MSGRAELRALTSLRGIAAWLVVLYHIRGSISGLPRGAERVLAQGYLAVDFFFLLSGFVIWMTWSERLRAEGLRAVPAFLRKRIARIWPLHGVMLAAAVALALLLAASGRHDAARFPWNELPLHVLLLQNWGFTSALAWNDPAWSISAELAAYLAFPLLALAIDWRRVPSAGVIAAIAAAFVLLAGIYAQAGASGLGEDITRLGLVRCLAEFGAGTAVGALWWRWRERPSRPAGVSLGVAVVALTGLFAGWLPQTAAVPAAFAALLLAAALTSGQPGNPLDARRLHALGEISYATYLGHFLLWFAFKLAFVRNAAAVPPALIALYLALVLISSILLYRYVERPAQAWINRTRAGPRLTRRRAAPRGTSAPLR